MVIGSALLAIAALTAWGAWLGGPGSWLCTWVAINALVCAMAYFARWPQMMGKGVDGVVPWWRSLLLGPFVVFTALMGVAKVWFGREPVCHEVAPGVYVGRRCQPRELPADVEVVVDLTCERTEPKGLRSRAEYHTLPTLDGTAPEPRAYRTLLSKLRSETRPIYIHCAMGHSRAATVAAGLLIARGMVHSADAAESLMKAVRPKVHFTRKQRQLVEHYAALCRATD